MMRKIAAFTLMELLIGMIVSSIVITFGYMAYSLIYERFLDHKTVKMKMMETLQLNTTLANDLQKAEIISKEEDKLILVTKNGSQLQYEFDDDFIVRKQNETVDTFKVAAKNIQQQFLFPESTMFLQKFSFESEVLNEQEYFYFTKIYSSETLMNYFIQTKANQ